MGAAKFQMQLKTFGVELPLGECKRIISVYRTTYPKIPELWDSAGRALTALKTQRTSQLGREGVLQVDLLGIKLPNGMYIRYPNLRAVDTNGKTELVYDLKKGRATITSRIYGGKVVENICQAVARQIVAEQMLRVSKRYKVVLTVHDAVAIVAPEAEAAEAQAYLEECMSWNPKWAVGLPLSCESGVGASYGDC